MRRLRTTNACTYLALRLWFCGVTNGRVPRVASIRWEEIGVVYLFVFVDPLTYVAVPCRVDRRRAARELFASASRIRGRSCKRTKGSSGIISRRQARPSDFEQYRLPEFM